MNKNLFKNKLKNNELLLGTFIKINDPSISEIIALSGLDFVIIDNEHSALDNNEIQNLIRGAHSQNCSAIIRTTKNDSSQILQALDMGSNGIQVPNIDTFDDAQMLESFSKFKPIGIRGFSATTKAAEYGKIPIKDYLEFANENTLVIAHCESKESYNNLDEILKVESIDTIFIGPMDLSHSFGIPGEVDHPIMKEAIETIVNKTLISGKSVGIFSSVENVNKYYEMGIRYMVVGVDQVILRKQYEHIVKTIKNSLGGI